MQLEFNEVMAEASAGKLPGSGDLQPMSNLLNLKNLKLPSFPSPDELETKQHAFCRKLKNLRRNANRLPTKVINTS